MSAIAGPLTAAGGAESTASKSMFWGAGEGMAAVRPANADTKI